MKGDAGTSGTKGERESVSKKTNAVPSRGDIHVLVVGDPGLGKSQMLKAVMDVAPRGEKKSCLTVLQFHDYFLS